MATSKIEREKEAVEQRTLFEQLLDQLKGYVQSQNLPRPKCFISYTLGNKVVPWEDSRVQRLVSQLAEDLRRAGIDVFVGGPNMSGIHQLQDTIAACNRILVIFTPLYLKRYDRRSSETDSILAAEMDLIFERLQGIPEQQSTVLPLMLSGNERFSLPPSLRSRVYADFRDDTRYLATAFDLVVNLYGVGFDDPVVTDLRQSIRKKLFGERFLTEQEPTDEPEFSPDQMKAALARLGEEIRSEAFNAGRPLIVLKDNRAVWVFPDGTEQPADFRNGPSVGEGDE